MSRSHCRWATGPAVTIVDCGPLRLKTWCSLLQPDNRVRPSPANKPVAKRETLRWAERELVMCNSGGISVVRCAKGIGPDFAKCPPFQTQKRAVPRGGPRLLRRAGRGISLAQCLLAALRIAASLCDNRGR